MKLVETVSNNHPCPKCGGVTKGIRKGRMCEDKACRVKLDKNGQEV